MGSHHLWDSSKEGVLVHSEKVLDVVDETRLTGEDSDSSKD